MRAAQHNRFDEEEFARWENRVREVNGELNRAFLTYYCGSGIFYQIFKRTTLRCDMCGIWMILVLSFSLLKLTRIISLCKKFARLHGKKNAMTDLGLWVDDYYTVYSQRWMQTRSFLFCAQVAMMIVATILASSACARLYCGW